VEYSKEVTQYVKRYACNIKWSGIPNLYHHNSVYRKYTFNNGSMLIYIFFFGTDCVLNSPINVTRKETNLKIVINKVM